MSVTYHKRYRMEIDLRGRYFEGLSPPTGYRLQPWSSELLEDHADAKLQSFQGEIDSEIFPCLGEWAGCRKLMEEISLKDGFLSQATWLATTQFGNSDFGEPVGTIQGIRANRRYGGIQNVGISPAHRGQGIGKCLIAHTLAAFQRAGLPLAYLEVTAQNTRAMELYRRLGFQRTKTLYKAVELALS